MTASTLATDPSTPCLLPPATRKRHGGLFPVAIHRLELKHPYSPADVTQRQQSPWLCVACKSTAAANTQCCAAQKILVVQRLQHIHKSIGVPQRFSPVLGLVEMNNTFLRIRPGLIGEIFVQTNRHCRWYRRIPYSRKAIQQTHAAV